MEQQTHDEAIVQAVDALWHIVENVREMNRSLYLMQSRGVSIRLLLDEPDMSTAKLLVTKIWPAVDKSVKKPKYSVLPSFLKRGKVSSVKVR